MPDNVDPYINYGLITYSVGPKDRSITSALGATQQVMPANPLRVGFFVENTSDTNWYLSWITSTVVAGGTGVFLLTPGSSIKADAKTETVPKQALYGLCVAAKTLYAQEDLGYIERP